VLTWEIVEGQLVLTGNDGKSWRYRAVEENTPVRAGKRSRPGAAKPLD